MNVGCAGKTVRSPENSCHTWAPYRCVHDKALHKSTFTLPHLTFVELTHLTADQIKEAARVPQYEH